MKVAEEVRLSALMILAGMPSFPGALLLAEKSIALLSSSTVGGASSSSMTGGDGVFSMALFADTAALE